MNMLIKKLQLDPTASLKRMSKGMKQKTAIVAALMAEPEILIFDEPTTGLDPLMRKAFVEIVEAERKKGRTIFMSSHMFDEVEELCDEVALIKTGEIVAVKSTKEILHSSTKCFKIEFKDMANYRNFISKDFDFVNQIENKNQTTVKIDDSNINYLFEELSKCKVKFMKELKYNLENYFNDLYNPKEN